MCFIVQWRKHKDKDGHTKNIDKEFIKAII